MADSVVELPIREEDFDADQIEKLTTLYERFRDSPNPTIRRKRGREPEGKAKKQGGRRGGEFGLGGDGDTPEEKNDIAVRQAFDFENEDFEEVLEVSRETVLQFLFYWEFDEERAEKALRETIAWRVEKQPHLAVLESPVMGGLRRKEMMWWKHRDIHGRPALILFGGRRNTYLETTEEKIRHFYWIVESAATLSQNGQFVVIFDLSGLGYGNIETTTVQEVAPLFGDHFPERLAKLFFVFSGSIFQMGWMMLKGWLDPRVAAKVHIDAYNGADVLLPYFTPDTLPERYGGKCDDKVLDVETYSLTTPDFLVTEREPTEEEKERDAPKPGWFW